MFGSKSDIWHHDLSIVGYLLSEKGASSRVFHAAHFYAF